MKDVKIVFIDIDGTLRNSSGKITDETIKSILRLKEEGLQIVLTTGRSLKYTINVSKLYDGGNYIISSNGAEIYNYKSSNMIYSSPIDEASLKFLEEKVLIHKLFFIANTESGRYSNNPKKEVGVKSASSLLNINEPINQVVIQSFDVERMKLFRRDLEDYKKLKISNKRKVPVEGLYLFYDVTNSDVSKGNAVKKLCEYLNISLDKTMAIGDSNNDIDMFEVCKYKVAVSNADEDLKKVSNIETLSNDQDGVKIVLDRLYSEIKG